MPDDGDNSSALQAGLADNSSALQAGLADNSSALQAGLAAQAYIDTTKPSIARVYEATLNDNLRSIGRLSGGSCKLLRK
jgi:hypothetical protein